ncbi:MAG: DegT/DnrJ/EryC1/StrS family aminotransferase [Anaerolineae bacterium]
MNPSIRMSAPDITAGEVEAVAAVLRTTCLSIGPQLASFEARLADLAGVRHGIGVNSGTSGLHLCVIAAGVGEGDLVLTTPFSFVASANCVLYERGIPVFVDVDARTGNIDPEELAEAAHDLRRGGPAADRWLPPALRHSQVRVGRLKAVLPVHAFGQPADMDAIVQVAREHDLVIIEDACEAIGAEYKGRQAGGLGDLGVFAFYPNKQMTTGEGGMIVTQRDDWAALMRSLRNQGRDTFDAWLQHDRLGYNYRLDELSAALGLAQVARLEELLAKRAQVAAWYDQRLGCCDDILVPTVAATTTRMSWFVYVVRLAPTIDRRMLMRFLEENGVPSRPYFTPIHLQPFYVERFGYQLGDRPVAEELGARSLALPFSSVMSEEQVDFVCACLKGAVARCRAV